MSYKRVVLLASLSFGYLLNASAAGWDEKYFNPVPDASDVVLPMPCDGSMVFRKVFIPVTGPLDDYPINIGQDSPDWGYVEQKRPAFIAGSFTPFTLSAPGHRHHLTALVLVWLAALVGCWLQLRARRAAPWLSTALYVAMGWVALLAALPLMAHVPAVSAAWLVIGGAAYTAGVVFFVMDAVVRYAHAVWHGCVVAGTGCHVIAVLGLQTVT